MPAMTSPLMALRFSGRLMVIQSAFPRFSSMTLLGSVIAMLACWSYITASWFETRGMAALLTMRVQGPHPEEAPTGPRKSRPDDKLRAVSKDEAAELENGFRQAARPIKVSESPSARPSLSRP